MIKKIFLLLFLLFVLTYAAFPMDLGLIVGVGTINNRTESIYGASGSWGFIIPMLKFEVEYYNLGKRKYEAVTGGLKLRKKLGKFAPYALIGVGAEFENITFHTGEYETFLFVGGGVHFFMIDFVSIRGDIRFLNYADYNKTRLSVGVFVHI